MAKATLDCGHPTACWRGDYDEDVCCRWCEEVRNLKSHNAALREQIHKTAIVIHGGEHAIAVSSPIGLVEILGGTVNFHDGDPDGCEHLSVIGRGSDDAKAKEALRQGDPGQAPQT
ncbi:hypothetical protein LCGC14_1619600 [marine sediment metagenome]|uniref:Uncharacterized protein n=1 Tax=marine sediment metagenome TaxID=412755 RepID=A0A0F9I614_9ZZZZ